MKNFTSSALYKTIISLVLIVSISVSFLGALLTAYMDYNGYYNNSIKSIEERTFDPLAYNVAGTLFDYFGMNYDNPYIPTINEIYAVLGYSGLEFTVETDKNVINIPESLSGDYEYSFKNYVTRSVYDDYGNYIAEITCTVTCHIPESLINNTDEYNPFATNRSVIAFLYKIRYTSFILFLIFLLVALIALIAVTFSAGKQQYDGGIHANFLDRIPFDLITVVFAALLTGIAVLWLLFIQEISPIYVVSVSYISASVLMVLAMSALIVLYYTTLVTRIKLRSLFKNTLVYKTVYFIFSNAVFLIKCIPTIWKTALVLAVICFLGFAAIIIFEYEPFLLIICWLLLMAVISVIALYCSYCFSVIKRGARNIRISENEYKIKTGGLVLGFKDFADDLNSISDGIAVAVNERTKSERMKTELITNVSHDIKTPLTSIINYVDLIKKHDISEEPLKGYVDVLDRQSIRLKKLIDDLIEVSKLSTGNITANPAPCELGVMLTQTIGEYEEKAAQNGLQLILFKPEHPVTVLADGQHLWRIFDNLMNNICKYSQPGTRVYLSLAEIGNTAVITFKNISKQQLNVSPDELMERFVRGDSSRNTEGSGLGLSIASSLMQLQGGTLDLSVDGDLFKATLSFFTIQDSTKYQLEQQLTD